MKKFSVSILSSDFGHLADDLRAVEDAGADWIHADVMDSRFVPDITMGPARMRAVRRAIRLPLDVHLKVTDSDAFLEPFIEAGADRLGVHVETARQLHRTIARIKQPGARATVTLNPATPLTALGHILANVNMVLLMTVDPGFSGQSFIRGMLKKSTMFRIGASI